MNEREEKKNVENPFDHKIKFKESSYKKCGLRPTKKEAHFFFAESKKMNQENQVFLIQNETAEREKRIGNGKKFCSGTPKRRKI